MSLDQHGKRVTDIDQQDAFHNPITGYRNDGDLPSHHKATPQRYNLFVDGQRVNWYYDNVTQDAIDVDRTGDGDVFVLTPDAGQSVTFETARRYRYIVGYEVEASFALQTNQPLQGSDEVRAFVGNNEGYHFVFTADGCTVQIRRNDIDGVVASKEVPTAVGLETFSRLVWTYNWYNVGRCQFNRTFSKNGSQFQPTLGNLSADGENRGPDEINTRIGVEVTPDPATTGLEVFFGSAGYSVKQGVARTARPKAFTLRGMTYANSGEWEALVAFRHDPSEVHDILEAREVDILSGPTDAEISMHAFDPALITANWNDPDDDGSNLTPRAPTPLTDYNVSLQYTKNVTEFPDETGAVVTGAPPSTTQPGGYQLVEAATATSSGTDRSASAEFIRQVSNEDYAVVLGKAAGNGEFEIQFTFEMDF